MLQKILVALDLLDDNEIVFAQALDLAVATGADLMLVHALSGLDNASPALSTSPGWDYYTGANDSAWRLYQSDWLAYEQRGLETLRHYVQRAGQSGVKGEFLQSAHDPGRLICQVAQNWMADAIVVGSHGRRGLSALLLGSVSNHVMHHAPCSVMVVRLNLAQPRGQQLEDGQPQKVTAEKVGAEKVTAEKVGAEKGTVQKAVVPIRDDQKRTAHERGLAASEPKQ